MPRQEESEKQYHWPIEKQYRDLYCWCGSENALREIAFTQELLRKSFARTKPPNPASITLLLALIAARLFDGLASGRTCWHLAVVNR